MITQTVDSVHILNSQKEVTLTTVKHVFAHHELVVNNKNAIPIVTTPEYWPISILIIGLVLVILLRVKSPKKFFMLLQSFFFYSAAKQLIREDYRLNKGSSLVLILLFVLNFPFFLVKATGVYSFFPHSFNTFFVYLIFLVILILLYTTKVFFLKMTEFLTQNKSIGDEYIHYTFLSIKAMGLFLYPVLVFMEYSNVQPVLLIILGLLTCMGFYAIRILRGILVLFNSGKVSIFHLFLYLCTLELIPLIVLIKILMSGKLIFS